MPKQTKARAKEKVRRAEKRISTLKKYVSKKERELELLRHYKHVLEISVALSDKLPESYSGEDAKKDLRIIQRIIDLVARVNWELAENPPDPKWPAAQQLQHEVHCLHPFLSQLVPSKSLVEFFHENKLQLWYAFCTEREIRERTLPEMDHCKNWDEKTAKDTYHTFVQQLWVLSGWNTRGRRFQVTPLLANTFCSADIPVSAEFLKPPFPLMLFELPHHFVVRQHGNVLPVRGFVVYYDDTEEVRLTIVGIVSSARSPRLVYAVPFGQYATIQEDINSMVRDRTTYGPTVQAEGEEHPVYQVVNFVCNAILYCTSFPGDVIAHNEEALQKLERRVARGGKKVQNVRKKLAKARNESIYILGRNFRLDDERASQELDTDEPVRIQSLHIVRGHWRNQAHGPKYSLRKLIFIQPFWKGVGKPGPVKKYVVK